MNLKDQVAVITGAASGIGLSIAKKLLGLDAKVCVLDFNSDEDSKNYAEYGDRVLS